MILLNLISPEQKQALNKHNAFQFVENILGLLIILAVVVSLVLIPIYYKLDKNLVANLKNTPTSNQTQASSLNNQINQLNLQASLYNQIAGNYYAWSDLVNNLALALPDNVYFEEFASNLNDRKVNLRGYAKSRDLLIALVNNLNKSPYLESVDSPIANYLSETDIKFIITAKLK